MVCDRSSAVGGFTDQALSVSSRVCASRSKSDASTDVTSSSFWMTSKHVFSKTGRELVDTPSG